MNPAERQLLSRIAGMPAPTPAGDFAGAPRGRVGMIRRRAGVEPTGGRSGAASADNLPGARACDLGLLLLAPGAVRRLPCRAGARLTVMAGHVWLTESGTGIDQFVGPGCSALIEGHGRVVLECVSPQAALLDVQPAARAKPWRAHMGPIAPAAVRIITELRRLTHAVFAPLRRLHQAADPGLGALSEWQLKDIGAPERLIQAARERELVERRWRDTVLGDRQGSW